MIRIGNYKTDITPFVLGRGTYATVYLGYDNTNEKVAIKVIEKTNMIKDNKLVRNEINIMNFIKSNPHNNVIKCIDIIENDSCVYIILEYCNSGTLHDLLEKVKESDNKYIPEPYVKYFFIQIISGFTFLRSHNIIHRDIKTKNILISDNKNYKIADFGLASFGDGLLDTICGSPLYMAPEIVTKCIYRDNVTRYDDSIDIWSLGIIFYQMLYGVNPYNIERGSVSNIYDMQKHEAIEIPRTDMPHIVLSSDCIELLKSMLQKDCTKRIKWHSFSSSPWIKNLGYVITQSSSTNKKESGSPLKYTESSKFQQKTSIYHDEYEVLDDYLENIDKYQPENNSIFDIELN